MMVTLQRTTAFALYQLSLLIGLLLLPVALIARQGGLTLPVDRIIERTRRAYASTQDGH